MDASPVILEVPAALFNGDPILFRQPELLWLLLVPPLLVLLLPGRASIPDRLRNMVTLLGRIVTLSALIVAVAQPFVQRRPPDLSLVVAADLSASMTPERLADVMALADQYRAAAPGGVEIRTVGLGASAALDGLPEPAAPQAGTDVAALIELALAAAPPARSRRVLLLSDGADTEGALGVERAVAVAAAAAGAGARVYPVPPAVPQINRGFTDLSLPLGVRAGKPAEAVVTLHSSGPAEVAVALMLEEQPLATVSAQLRAGTQEVTLPFTAPRAGTHRVEVRVAEDAWPQDDRRGGWMVTTGEGPVVLHGEHAAPLAEQLRRRGLSARVAEAWPSSLPEGAAFVVLGPEMDDWPESRPRWLQNWVRDDGGDLILAGGPKGLGVEAPWMTALNRTLPVVFPDRREREPPPLAVVYVLDRSDSMARERKLELAIAAIDASVAMLPPEARLGVLAFADDFRWVVPMTRARNPDAVSAAMRRLSVAGGTRIYPALGEAFEALAATDAVLKHVILLTDGTGVTRYNQNLSLLEKIGKSKVTVSTVALSAEANTKELQKVAELGHGRAYYTETLSDIPRIFVDETMMLLRKNAIEQDETVRPIPGSALAGAVDWTTAPTLAGHNEARAKTTAELGLVMGDRSRPLLASWRYGLGSATVFTSQLGGGWGARWMEWGPHAEWLEALIKAVRRRPPSDELELRLDAQDSGLSVTLLALDAMGSPREELAPTLKVRGDSSEQTYTLVEEAPGRYVGRAPWDGPLLVTATVEAGEGTPAGVVQGQAAPPVPRELSGELMDLNALEDIAAAGQGSVLPEPAALFREGVRTRIDELDAWPWFVWLALASLVLDVAARRLRWARRAA
ncbi:MAG: VWA domain-containing protein [Alphaproteobacteria bacterium]|nr:VWA domain-containing protein [Alphaproteobacteria bacterium]